MALEIEPGATETIPFGMTPTPSNSLDPMPSPYPWRTLSRIEPNPFTLTNDEIEAAGYGFTFETEGAFMFENPVGYVSQITVPEDATEGTYDAAVRYRGPFTFSGPDYVEITYRTFHAFFEILGIVSENVSLLSDHDGVRYFAQANEGNVEVTEYKDELGSEVLKYTLVDHTSPTLMQHRGDSTIYLQATETGSGARRLYASHDNAETFEEVGI